MGLFYYPTVKLNYTAFGTSRLPYTISLADCNLHQLIKLIPIVLHLILMTVYIQKAVTQYVQEKKFTITA